MITWITWITIWNTDGRSLENGDITSLKESKTELTLLSTKQSHKLLNKLLRFLMLTTTKSQMIFQEKKELQKLNQLAFQFILDTYVMDVVLNQLLEIFTNVPLKKISIIVLLVKLPNLTNSHSLRSNVQNKDQMLSSLSCKINTIDQILS